MILVAREFRLARPDISWQNSQNQVECRATAMYSVIVDFHVLAGTDKLT
jgi:hypothetical protein